jgi:hypothetical protein
MRRFLSLGAGVQSSTLALMIAHGELEPVEAAIFADTQWEPKHVYKWLDWLEAEIKRCPYPFPIYRVTKGHLRDDNLYKRTKNGNLIVAIPWFIKTEDGVNRMGMLRGCTRDYKIAPVTKKQKELCGYKPRQRINEVICETLIGISTDEAMRMKPSQDSWKVHRWPLIEKNMNRSACLAWMERKGYPLPPKSSCIGCPYHSDREWRLIKADPEAWANAVETDRLIRKPIKNRKGEQFMHRSCVPLDEVDLSTAADHGQVDMFNNECEGMCGV